MPIQKVPAAAWRRIGVVGLILTLAAVFWITLTPQPFEQDQYSAWVEWTLNALHAMGVPPSFGYSELEVAANVVMFVPLGLFLTLALERRRAWVGLVALPALSGGIELAQLLFLPTRYPTLSDILANSLGAWIGIGAIALIRMYARGQLARPM